MPKRIASKTEKPAHIREWRLYRGLTQEALADLIGSTKGSISRLESGDQPYTQASLEALAKALGTTPADLLAGPPGDEEPPDPTNEAFLALLLAAIFERIGNLGETEAAVLAESVLEASRMPADELAAVSDPVALARALAAFGSRRASLPKKQ